MSASPTDPERLSDATARELLARAAQLDNDGLTLQQLREAATEAGISSAAFDQAVTEWRGTLPTKNSVARPVSLSRRVLRNAAAFAGGWAAVAGLSAIDRLLSMPWLVHKLTDPLGLALGAAIALKLRARTATAILGGLTVSQFAEYLLDFVSGAPAIHGLPSHIALMLAGIAGVAAGQHFWSCGSGRGPSASDDVGEHGPPSAPARAGWSCARRLPSDPCLDGHRQYLPSPTDARQLTISAGLGPDAAPQALVVVRRACA